MERSLIIAIERCGYRVVRAHEEQSEADHRFIASQREGIEVFRRIPPKAPLIAAEAVWQYSHHVLAGLTTHRGPILAVANWSGQWPGSVGMLDLNGSLTKVGVRYSTLWREQFKEEYFLRRLKDWLTTGRCEHDTSHVHPLTEIELATSAAELGQKLALELRRDKAIMGVFDEGCMGMFNAIIPDDQLPRPKTGAFKSASV